MKRMFTILLALVLVLAIAGPAAAALLLTDSTNRHNLSKDSSNAVRATAASGETRICVFCHTPHSGEPQTPLWNRKDITVVETFPLYNSPTLAITGIAEAEYDGTNYPNGATRMCLSCHDGSAAVGYGIGDLRDGTSIPMTDSYLDPGTYTSAIDLSVSHPVSFVYDENADGVAGTVISQIESIKGIPGAYTLPFSPDDVPLDGLGRMQCTTCHDPHKDTSDEPAKPPFWRYPGLYEDTCLECHSGFDDVDPWAGDPMH